MAPAPPIRFTGFIPYLYCRDAAARAEWLTRVFGFVEKGRHTSAAGDVQNIELLVGDDELWLDNFPGYQPPAAGPPAWTGVWVDDVDAMYARVQTTGTPVEPPEDKPYGVRMLSIKDPEGMTWGFMQRLTVG